MSRKINIKRLAMRFSDGGAQPPAEPTTPAQPGTTPTAAAQTQSTAANVDISQIIAQAAAKAVEVGAEAQEKKMESVFKSMLQQQGYDKEVIDQMTAKWKAEQVTPDDTIKRLQSELDTERGKNAAYEKAAVLRGHGLTDAEEIEIMSIRIDRLVTDGKDFAAAAQEYFTANPRPTKPPATVVPGVTGNTPLVEQANSLDAYKKLSPQDKIKFKQENPTLYEQFKKALGF